MKDYTAWQYKADLAERWAGLAWERMTQPNTAAMPNEVQFYKERAMLAAKIVLATPAWLDQGKK